MSFTIKLRGAPRRWTTETYSCPDHGKFECEIERDDAGDPPATIPCDVVIAETSRIHECGLAAEHCITAPLCVLPKGWADVTGKSDPHLPHQLDTRPLAEGMPKSEWDAINKKKMQELRRARNRRMVA